MRNILIAIVIIYIIYQLWQMSERTTPGARLPGPFRDGYGPYRLSQRYKTPNTHAGYIVPWHRGDDYAAPAGTSLVAEADGEVTRVWNSGTKGYGLHVFVYYPSRNATVKYGHLNSALVKFGQKVLKGTPIAYTGNTGNSTGPHLHRGASRGKVFFDNSLLDIDPQEV